jgi:hypothetical protein
MLRKDELERLKEKDGIKSINPVEIRKQILEKMKSKTKQNIEQKSVPIEKHQIDQQEKEPTTESLHNQVPSACQNCDKGIFSHFLSHLFFFSYLYFGILLY